MKEKSESSSQESLITYLKTKHKMDANERHSFAAFLTAYSRNQKPFQKSESTQEHPANMDWNSIEEKEAYLKQFEKDRLRLADVFSKVKFIFPLKNSPKNEKKVMEVAKKLKKLTKPIYDALNNDNELDVENKNEIIQSLRKAYVFALLSELVDENIINNLNSQLKIKLFHMIRDNMFENNVYQASLEEGFKIPSEYSVDLKHDQTVIESGKIYFEMADGKLQYTVINPSGEVTIDKINKHALPEVLNQPLDLKQLKAFLPEILKVTLNRGHTLPLDTNSFPYINFSEAFKIYPDRAFSILKKFINEENILLFCFKFAKDEQLAKGQKKEILKYLCKIPYSNIPESEPERREKYIQILKSQVKQHGFGVELMVKDLEKELNIALKNESKQNKSSPKEQAKTYHNPVIRTLKIEEIKRQDASSEVLKSPREPNQHKQALERLKGDPKNTIIKRDTLIKMRGNGFLKSREGRLKLTIEEEKPTSSNPENTDLISPRNK